MYWTSLLKRDQIILTSFLEITIITKKDTWRIICKLWEKTTRERESVGNKEFPTFLWRKYFSFHVKRYKMWTFRAIIVHLLVSQINGGPISPVTFLDFEDQNCSLNISAVLPNINDICKDVSSYDLSSSTESFNSKEKLCWAVHFHVKNMCHSGSTKLGNAVPPNGVSNNIFFFQK